LVGNTLDTYWDSEHGEIKYQVGEGCGIDQVVAQWHANLCGLGGIFDRGKTRRALRSIFRYNFKTSMRGHVNPARIFCVNDEAGAIICEYPRSRPAVALTYAEEAMHGFEYQAACHMIQEGMIEEGLELVRAVRDRYDGEKRNPWNEIECGSNYARSMASYALLPALSGFTFDMVKGHVGFAPRAIDGPARFFWCLNTGWGTFSSKKRSAALEVHSGSIRLKSFSFSGLGAAKSVKASADEAEVPCGCQKGRLSFEGEIEVRRRLAIRW
jgi:hypothetical protein